MEPGRSCPLHYRYKPEVFAGTPALTAQTLIVVGGLYGNPEALTAVEALLGDEPGGVRLVFNGDFHWFDIEPEAFAATHTCLPFLQDLSVDGRPRAVINNGSAGMANFRGDSGGRVTRLSLWPSARARYRVAVAGLWLEAVPVDFDAARWQRRFTAWWPPESVAHRAYFKRIAEGPDFDLENAARGHSQLLLPGAAAQRL